MARRWQKSSTPNPESEPAPTFHTADVDIKRTGTFRLPNVVRRHRGGGARVEADAQLLAALANPGALLDRNGIILVVNPAFAELLGTTAERLIGEPVLMWIPNAAEREAFGREYLGLRERGVGHAFVRELDFRVASRSLGSRYSARACKLEDGRVLVTCERSRLGDPAAELGRAVTRALDALDQGVFMVASDGRVVHANPAARALLGDALLGRGFLELVEPRRVETIGRALELARAGSWRGKVDLLRLDGEPIPVELSLAAGSGGGAPVVVLCRDLRATRQKEFDERLVAQIDRALVSASEPREALTAACRALATGLAARRGVILTYIGSAWKRWEVSPDGPPVYTTVGSKPDIPKQWSRDRGVVLELVPTSVHAAFFGRFAPDETAARIALRAPGGVVGYLLLSRDQRYPWTEHETQLIAQLSSQLALGLANGLLTLETRALVAYQARVLDQTAVLLNSVDADGRIVTWNRASEQLIGVSAEEANGKLFAVEVAPACDPEVWDKLWKTLRREGMITSELMVRNAEGEEVPIHFEGRLLRDGNEALGAVIVGLDLRVRRALEAQVLRSQKMAAVGLMAAGIAHEINNPLTGVVGYSKLLLEGRKLDADTREKVERIAASGERCRKIVEGVLLFSRQQGNVDRRRLNLGELVDRVVLIGEYQWKMHNVRIERQLQSGIEVMADADQLEQVLLNLLSNAVDAMPTGGRVAISLSDRGDGNVSLSVSDSGVGIPPEIRDTIFDPFFSTKEIGKGTGLGLSISYGIVRDHGGDILLESELGHGTTFTVILPKDRATSAPGDGTQTSRNSGQ